METKELVYCGGKMPAAREAIHPGGQTFTDMLGRKVYFNASFIGAPKGKPNPRNPNGRYFNMSSVTHIGIKPATAKPAGPSIARQAQSAKGKVIERKIEALVKSREETAEKLKTLDASLEDARQELEAHVRMVEQQDKVDTLKGLVERGMTFEEAFAEMQGCKDAQVMTR